MAEREPVLIRPLAAADLEEADRIYRIAFGTFFGEPDPERFRGDSDVVRTRWHADPHAALAAERGGRLVGSNFVTNWGSVGLFGPLSVDPACWDQGIAARLLEPTMDLFSSWGTRHAGLFTFAHSAKHVALYQKFGFWPRFLTAIMSMPVKPPEVLPLSWTLSDVAEDARDDAIQAVRELTDAVYPGLDVTREIDAVLNQKLGDTILLGGPAGLHAAAVCHVGAGSEAGSGSCYVKFGAVRPGADAGHHFSLLLDACHQLAADRGASVLAAGMNAGRDKAWRALRERGFRVVMQGVTMHRPNDSGYSQSDAYVIDDWR